MLLWFTQEGKTLKENLQGYIAGIIDNHLKGVQDLHLNMFDGLVIKVCWKKKEKDSKFSEKVKNVSNNIWT